MNKADSERLGSALGQMGFVWADDPRDAQVVVLNSCVVRQGAEDKVVSALGLFKSWKQGHPRGVLALMGCMVGPGQDNLAKRFPWVDLFMRPQEYRPLLAFLGERNGIDWEGCLGPLIPLKPTVTSFVPIIHGCDLFCAFCIIPYRRGRQRSRPMDEVVSEVCHLAERGVKEVTVLGQTVDAYGYDLPDRPTLGRLLEELDEIEGLARIRFLTSHPNFLTEDIIEAVARCEKVCEHINLPFQAGDDRVLQAMRRGYTRDDYRKLVHRIRQAVPDVALSTDVVAGFCGETEEQFQKTVDLLEELRFDKVHIAAYSPRPGTIAWRQMRDDVPQEEKESRLRYLEQRQAAIAAQLNISYEGTTVEVLVDGQERGKWRGRTRTDKLVFFPDGGRNWLGELVQVRIAKTSPWALQGEIAGGGGV
ncbi:MAG: tRNA (N6-isopentenyl adenosine(37)-C2)-methylthiotransferase MiaB [Chloroflexi bacterium]|nr:tRNA (N6-isopentenyl adenosine(37)-C2)-methylthiotransferase MiaB [Chloroflexota bacterium]